MVFAILKRFCLTSNLISVGFIYTPKARKTLCIRKLLLYKANFYWPVICFSGTSINFLFSKEYVNELFKERCFNSNGAYFFGGF